MSKVIKLFKYSFLSFTAFLPQSLKRFVYNQFLGWDIDKTAKIGVSFINVKKLEMGAYATIGNFNVFKGLELVRLGEYSKIRHSNVFSALPLNSQKHFSSEKDRFPAFIMGKHSLVAGKNRFDCCNTITMGELASIVGSGTFIYTHGINMKEAVQETRPVSIGNYARVFTRCIIVKGTKLPDFCILGPNSTLHKPHEETYTFYSGVPAIPVKKLSPELKVFHRTEEYVA